MVKFSDLPTSIIEHSILLAESYARVTGGQLIKNLGDDRQLARALFDAPFVVLSHGAEDDPIFNYANAAALALFKYEWAEFMQLPSRLSAEQPNREERARLLKRVTEQGFIDDYSGVRIAKDGTRFLIEKATVWNLLDEEGCFCGQAATFSNWKTV